MCRKPLLFNHCTSNYDCNFKNNDNNDTATAASKITTDATTTTTTTTITTVVATVIQRYYRDSLKRFIFQKKKEDYITV